MTTIVSALVIAGLGIGNVGTSSNQNITVNINKTGGDSGGYSEGGCSPFWQCTAWSRCVGYQTRTCSDTNLCNANSTKPALIQQCTVPPGTNLYCGDKICGDTEDSSWCPDCALEPCTFNTDCVLTQGYDIYCLDKAYPTVEGGFRLCTQGLTFPDNRCVCSAILYNMLSFS